VTAPEAPKTSRSKDRLLGALLAGKYRISQKIGEGGMGAVYIATQEPIDRKVAVKVLLGKLAEDDIAVKRFEQEARAISKMQHPNTVTIYDFGRTHDDDDGQERLYIVMEYLKGRTLTQVLRSENNLVGVRAARIVRQVCASLADAHAAGIIHRDLKPDNIFLTEVGGDKDWVKVLDFGVAKLADSEAAGTLTQTGMIFGTPKYMSPEQAEGRPLDHRADIYALGVVLYELLAGRPPFVADTPVGLLLKHIQEVPPPFGELRPDLTIDPRLEAVVMRALEKAPDARFQMVSDLAAELEGYERSVSGGYAAPTGTIPTPMSSGLPTEVVGQGPQYTPAGLRSPEDVPPDLSEGLGEGEAPPSGSTHALEDRQATQQGHAGAAWGGVTAPQTVAGGDEVSEGLSPATPRRRAPSGGLVVAVVALLAAVAAFAVVQWRAAPPEEPVRTTALSDAPARPEAEASPVEPSEPGAPAEPEPSAPSKSKPVEPPEDSPERVSPRPPRRAAPEKPKPERTVPARVAVKFESEPPGAVVYFEREQIGVTPFELPIERDRTMELVFRKKGFERFRRTVEADEKKTVRVELERARRRAPAPQPKTERTDPDRDEKVSDLK